MGLPLDEATQSWDVLAQHLERFIETWEATGAPPSISDHLPTTADELRRVVLIELIKVDLEYRTQQEVTLLRLEDYAKENPELCLDGKFPCDLIYEEYHVRRTAGEAVQPTEYFARFPDNTEELERLLPMESPDVSTALFSTVRPGDDIEPGEKLDDFNLLLRLGKGAFASVFLARQESMQRLVALKISADQGSEPQTLAQLDHPHIVRVYDQRQLPDRKLRLLYMQYVAGGTLQSVVDRASRLPMSERSGRLVAEAAEEEAERSGQVLSESSTRRRLSSMPWPEVICRLGAQLASALDYAHNRGVLHRDIKPANVLLAADGAPKLADFNISFSSNVEGATPAAYFGGSLAYMSPEQLEACNPGHLRQADELDGRSDLYSLAVMLWELLHGERPFQDEQLSAGWIATLEQMTQRRLDGLDEIQQPAHDDSTVRELQRVLLECLAPDRDDRYPTGESLAREFSLILQPRTQRLLRPRKGWRDIIRRRPRLYLLLAALLPNIFAGAFNYIYNREAIREHLEEMVWQFDIIVGVINSIFYPLGIAIALYMINPIAKQVLQPKANDSEHAAWVRQRTLALGHWAAVIGIVVWLIAGIAYPTTLNLLRGDLHASWYAHFSASLAICGLVGATYPFFLVTFLCVRVFYPMQLHQANPGVEDEHALERLSSYSSWYLYGAGGIPVIGILVLLISSLVTKSQNTPAMIVLSVLSFLGSLFAFSLCRIIQRDIEALLKAVAPSDSFGMRTDTFTSLSKTV